MILPQTIKVRSAAFLLEELNHFHENVEDSMSMASIQKYELYSYIGALFNTALIWLEQDSETRPEEMVRFFLKCVSGMIGDRCASVQRGVFGVASFVLCSLA